jgi:hypothetical protein
VFVVAVIGGARDNPELVLAEWLNHDEDYGFDDRVTWRPAPTSDVADRSPLEALEDAATLMAIAQTLCIIIVSCDRCGEPAAGDYVAHYPSIAAAQQQLDHDDERRWGVPDPQSRSCLMPAGAENYAPRMTPRPATSGSTTGASRMPRSP